ncbi:NAD-dependent epimerase/dehydratase family protein [Sporosarcina sp. ANT_H38]|uniref:NAD-dependent epimerase/dehydratase family protein n=1 Tax=Sporosarcina sp. ANT_H38 TaxID=2597358 RepID=UPI00165DF6D2|nr:NAD-dependent epimerase/dehydratase family protein [Sporosarcina sp. ANT_H38]
MKVLITGGAGFIGSHVVEELLNYKYEVVVVDNLVTGFIENLPKETKIYVVDLNDPILDYIFNHERPDFVIHLAAQASVTVSMNDPYLDFDTNIAGTVKVLLLCGKYNVRKIIFASSAAVYGEPTYLPIDEQHSINPKSFYALSKSVAEKYIEFYGASIGLDYCIFRFSNVYGPRQNGNGEAGVVSIFINRLLLNEKVNIYDGGQSRDLIYVKDVATACRCAVEEEQTGIFNISSNTETVIDDLFYLLASITEGNKAPVYEPRRMGEIQKSILCNQKALNEFEWNVRSVLSEGLQETVKYYSECIHSNT